jgi:hypothetical protein
MTLDLLLICILGVPIAGIAAIRAASPRQFVLRDGELVGLTSLNDEFAPVSFSYAARNRTSEVTMTKPVEDDLNEALKRLGPPDCSELLRIVATGEKSDSMPGVAA